MKKPMPVSIDNDMAEWISSIVDNERYRNKSHVVEKAIIEFQRKVMQNENSVSS